MKPIRVSFGCFGAFPGEETVYLSDVGRDGLFLICGDTGAGKTTLLDAMCYALYYTSSSGSDTDPGKGTFDKMRSRFVDESDKRVTFVELELEKNGETYIFRRELRPKKRAAGFDEVHDVYRLTGGNRENVLDNATQKTVSRFAEKLTGLTADQFRQIIILPQGKFEQLLTSDSAAKESILSTLFGVDTWEKAVARLQDQVKNERRELDNAALEITTKLSMHRCANVDALDTAIAERREAIPALEKAQADAAAAFERINGEVTSANAVEAKFAALDARTAALAQLQSRTAEIELSRRRLATAETAEKLRPAFDAVKRLRSEELTAKADAAAREKELKAAELTAADAEKAWQVHDGKRAQYEESRDYIIKLENARQDYVSFAAIKGKTEELEKKLRAAAANSDAAETAKKRTDTALLNANSAYTASRQECDRVRRLYTLGAAGRLAEALTEGEACPVCGSTHHPAPAERLEGHVSDAQLKQAEDAEKLAEKRYNDAVAAQKAAADKAAEAGKALAEAQALNIANQQQYEAAKAKLIPGIETPEQLEKKITAYRGARAKYEQEEETLKKRVEEARNAVNTLKGKCSAAADALSKKNEERKAAESSFVEQLVSEGFADEAAFAAALASPAALEALRKKITDFDGSLAHAREELELQSKAVEGLTRPDMNALKAAAAKAKGESENAVTAVSTAKKELEELTKLSGELREKAAQLEQRRAAWERRSSFCDMLDYKGMNLHRYVLATMLDQVIEQANQLLTNVHGGRYELIRSEDATGRKQKAGLELNVHDNGNDADRSVKSLSGGEKFLVSLALAIGLNTVMQAQTNGVRVEAIFVDEGFGTLDNDSVADAMQMLGRVRSSHGMVGIISHVDLLRSEIPSHVEIHKDAHHGSRIVR